MKKHLILLTLLSIAMTVSAQNDFWTVLNTVEGGEPVSLVQNENNGWIFLDFGNSVYRSTDNGQSWQKVYDWLSDNIGFDDVIIARNAGLYAFKKIGTSNFDLYKSDDGGDNWELTASGSPYNIITVTSNGVLFTSEHTSNSTKIMRSTDSGLTWSIVNDIVASFNAKIYTDKYDNLIINIDYRNYISQNIGETWVSMEGINYYNKFLIFPSGQYLRTTRDTAGQDNIVSGILGISGEEIVTPDSDTILGNTQFIQLSNSQVLAKTSSNLYVSNDEGMTWDLVNTVPSYSSFLTDHVLSNGTVFMKRGGAVFSSIDQGITWNLMSSGITHGVITDIKFSYNPRTMWVLSNNLFYKTQNEGVDWTRVTSDADPNSGKLVQSFFLSDDNELFISEENKLLKSTDIGQSFTELTYPGSKVIFMNYNNLENIIFLKTDCGLFQSNNLGSSWVTINDPLNITKIVKHSSGKLFSIVLNSGQYSLYVSDNGGIDWQLITLSANTSSRMRFEETNTGEIYLLANPYDIYKCDSDGNSWTKIPTPFANLGILIIGFSINSQGHIYAFSQIPYKAFRTINNGENWTQIPWFNNPYPQGSFIASSGPRVFDENDYLYVGIDTYVPYIEFARSTFPTTFGANMFGNAATSDDILCTTIDPVAPLKNTIFKAQGTETWYTTTDTLAGNYQMFIDTGSYQVSAQLPLPFLWDTCSISVDMPLEGDTTYTDLSVPAIVECPFVTMELTIPTLERCFERDIYLNYCNYGTVAADSVVLFLELDPLLSISNPAQPWALMDTANINLPCYPRGLDSNAVAWYLPIGSLDISECAQLTVPILVDCAAEPGQTHCITAYSCPDDLCINSQNWSGANIEVDAICAGDSVQLSIRNSGTAPSQILPFVVIEDDVVLFDGGNSYQPNEVASYSLPSNGEYFRIESQQEPGHPFPQLVAAWYVGCNGEPIPAGEFINQFPTTGGYASEDTDCAPNTGSYDPNDKQGLPLGYGNDHLIERGVEIEYLIRFQNTGTAPAHKVVVRDTLSSFLDPGSIRIGAGSHPFTWTLTGEGILVFTFDDINLPDSSANEAASHGFASYRIAQKPALPLGTDIFNSAAIFFDFNPPIITNATQHRIGEDFLETVGTDEVNYQWNLISAYPNPALENAMLDANGAAELRIYSTTGRLLRIANQAQDGHFIIKKEELPSGVYFLSLLDKKGSTMGRGKMVFR